MYSLGHNILELYSVLVQVQFTASKTRLDTKYNKLGIRVASQAAEPLKTLEIKKYQKNQISN